MPGAHPRFRMSTLYFVQRGDTGTLRILNDRFNVVGEVWEGPRLLDTWVERSFDTETEARAEARRLNEAERRNR